MVEREVIVSLRCQRSMGAIKVGIYQIIKLALVVMVTESRE
jgi:hypothetical protein